MKNLLKSKAGVTVLEGVIALGLLAVVAGGAFGVLLSVSRQNFRPDVLEEMALAVEKVNDSLKMYQLRGDYAGRLPEKFQLGLCGGTYATPQIEDNNPLSVGTHHIECMLPPICDTAKSSFTYTISDTPVTGAWPLTAPEQEGCNNTECSENQRKNIRYAMGNTGNKTGGNNLIKIAYYISCNGYEL